MKIYDANDGDRWRAAREELRAKCCGELDASGTCFAPACRQGEALKAMDEMLDYIEFGDSERKRFEEELSQYEARCYARGLREDEIRQLAEVCYDAAAIGEGHTVTSYEYAIRRALTKEPK